MIGKLELTRLVPIDRLSSAASVFSVEADAGECAAVAGRLQLPAVLSLSCRFTLVRRQERVEAQGVLEAQVVRECVVSLEPFESAVQERFTVDFVPPGTENEDEEDPFSTDKLPFTGASVDVGEAAVQQLALVLDPYPRKPGAAVPVDDAAVVHPFAALARLRQGG